MDSGVYCIKRMLAKQLHCLLLENFPDKNILFFSPTKPLKSRKPPAFSIFAFIPFPFLDCFPPGLPRKRHPAPNLFSSKPLNSLVLQQLTGVFIPNRPKPPTTRRVRHGRSMGFCPSLYRPLEIPIFGHKQNESFPRPSFKFPAEKIAASSTNRASDTNKKYLVYIKIFQKSEKALHRHHLPIAPSPKETKQWGRFPPRSFSWLRLFLLRLGLVRIFLHTGQKHPQKRKRARLSPGVENTTPADCGPKPLGRFPQTLFWKIP